MTPLERPRQYLLGITAEEAEAARQVMARGLMPPMPDYLKPFQDDAAAVFSKLTGVVESSKEPKVGGQ